MVKELNNLVEFFTIEYKYIKDKANLVNIIKANNKQSLQASLYTTIKAAFYNN